MKDPFNQLFEKARHQFDIEEPRIGHFQRFEAKLNKAPKFYIKKRVLSFVAVAASILLLFSVWMQTTPSARNMELANVSEEMEETQNYFMNAIAAEVETIEKERNSETDALIKDSFEQIKNLEIEYNNLKNALGENSENQQIIFAMVTNFQHRIDVLQNLLAQIQIIKQYKTHDDEKSI